MSAQSVSLLIFNWNQPRSRNVAIAGFITASVALHLAGFYLFQVVYPPTVSLLPAPQRVSLLTATSEQTATLVRWIDAEDPALVSATRRPLHAQRYEVGKIEHIPSYLAFEPALKEPPPLTVDLRLPSAEPPGPVAMQPTAPVSSTKISPTQVTFSNELRELGQPNFDGANFKASGKEPPLNAQFRIAVDVGGAVRYCFIVNSSGDSSLDQQAREQLALCRFQASPVLSATLEPSAKAGSKGEGSTSNADALVWGTATIEWGNDVAAPETKQTPSAP